MKINAFDFQVQEPINSVLLFVNLMLTWSPCVNQILMNLNWILSNNTDQNLERKCVDLEYQLRPKILKLLISKFDFECCTDFSCFHFDIDVAKNTVSISPKTPVEYIEVMKDDFNFSISTLK